MKIGTSKSNRGHMCTVIRSSEEVETLLNSFLNEMRIELKETEVPTNRVVEGRVFFDLKSETTIESIELDFKRTLALARTDGRVILPSGEGVNTSRRLKLLPTRQAKLAVPGFSDNEVRTYSTRPPTNDCALVETLPYKVSLQAGTSAIPFHLYLPKSLAPSFTYNSLKGSAVISSYSVEAVVRMHGVTKRTGRVAIHVPALGKYDVVAKVQGLNCDLLVTNKNFSAERGFGYTLNFSKLEGGHEQPDRVMAQVFREASCPALGLREIRPLGEERVVQIRKENTNPVLEEYLRNPSTAPLTNRCEYCAYESDVIVDSSTPTVNTKDFNCNYYLQVDCEGRKYRAPLIKVDGYDWNL